MPRPAPNAGSRDLSTPQPKVPFWAPILEFILSLVPGVILTALSLAGIVFFLHQLFQRPEMLFSAVMLLIALGILWWMWGQIPQWLRSAIYRMLKRKREGDGPKGGR
jgi:hypothetical protein